MTYTQQIIKKAIAGGYKGYENCEVYLGDDGNIYTFGEPLIEEKLFLDPKFWQALGKSLNWSNAKYTDEEKGLAKRIPVPEYTWREQQHKFLDHIQENKDPESRFKILIDNNG